jgi:hypothetical protein
LTIAYSGQHNKDEEWFNSRNKMGIKIRYQKEENTDIVLSHWNKDLTLE